MSGIQHDMIVLNRTFAAPVDRLFAAWQDTESLQRWCYPGDENWESVVTENDFREGGMKRITFGPRGAEPYREETRYLNIVPGERIICQETILNGDDVISHSLISLQFAADGGGAALTVTDQIALLAADETTDARRGGWGEVLDRLGPELEGV